MTTVEHSAFASPLSLLHQWRDDLTDGSPLRELVVLGFTLDLAFFERFCVPPARQLGARVTVVADADQGKHDAVDVHFAGRSYQHGAAFLPGAFHPKVAVLLGDEHVWFAIGSGNPTMAGWGHNQELWFVLRGRVAIGPRVQADLGTWLQRLPDHVSMPSWIATSLVDVGRRLTPADVDDTHPDVHLLHNLDTSILNEIPDLTAAELRLAAPFVDSSGQAVRDLVDRAAPGRLRIALQRDMSSFNGKTLLDVTATVDDVEFRDVDDQRTMHGKLIEWTAPDGGTTAIVGSPNLTSAALLGSVGEGRNCELAVAAPVRESLLPDAQRLSTAEVAARGWNRPDIPDSRPGLHLLGCRVDQDGLLVELRSRHAVDVTVETSSDGSPGSWAAKTIIAAAAINPRGTTTGRIEAPEVVGGAVRAVAVIRGARIESAAVFVTDVRRCRPRTDVADAPRLRQEYGIDELITDPALGARFNHDLMRLLDLSARAKAGSPATGALAVSLQSETDRRQRFLDVVAHSVGGALAGLTFPGTLPSPAPVTPTTGWSAADIADETELADGETESAIENINPASARPAPQVPRALRSLYRGWMRRWVARITPTPTSAVLPALPLRMTVGALYLELLAAGVWGVDDGWRTELADIVAALTADPAERAEAPEQSHPYLGSLLAVCLALLLQDASLHGGAPADVVARRAWEAAHERAARADPTIVEAMLLTSTQADARLATPSEVAVVAGLALNALDDPHAESLAGLASDGFDIERHDGVWIVRGKVRNTLRVAARVVTELDTPDSVAAVATNVGRTTIMLRRGDLLVMADSILRRWRTYLIGWPSTPMSLFAGGDGVPSTRQVAPLHPIPTDVDDLAQRIGCSIEPLTAVFLPPPARRALPHGQA